MALSITAERPDTFGTLRAVVAKVGFDDDYAEGGLDLKPAWIGLKEIVFVPAVLASGYVVQYDYENQKLQAFYAAYDESSAGPLAEVEEGTDLSEDLADVRLLVFGR